MIIKPALDRLGKAHNTIDSIQEGVAGGWRVVIFKDGHQERMTTTELYKVHGCNPFANVHPLTWI